jgi:glucosamine--fructose-6-phosphate aminotransferase (isomerizing)
MCGIVGAISNKNVLPYLIQGLERLEYRGYDSAGVAVINGNIQRIRSIGRVSSIKTKVDANQIEGLIGIGHTRWATHGGVTESNAHPHISNNEIALVHNGIIENHDSQCEKLKKLGYQFESETDTEVIAHLIHYFYKKKKDLLKAVNAAIKELRGAYAIAVVSLNEKNRLIAARNGCPLLIGFNSKGSYIASDISALLAETNQINYLNDGDIADLKESELKIFDLNLKPVKRKVIESKLNLGSMDLGPYSHFMQKEIYEQPSAISDSIEAIIDNGRFDLNLFGKHAEKMVQDFKF